MKFLTSLAELFTFDPDPQGEEIARVANVAVASYTLYEHETQKHRALTCKCHSCRQDLINAEDRVAWATEYPVCVVRKGKRVRIQYSSGDQGEEGEQFA